MQRKILVIITLVMVVFALMVGELVKVTPQNSSLSEKSSSDWKIPTPRNNSDSKFDDNTNPLIKDQDGPTIGTGSNQESNQTTQDNSEQPVFQVKTDYGYECTEGDPRKAIQNAIYSLPEDRMQPLNIYLTGTFDPVYDIILENNVNFIGNNAKLVIDQHESIFVLDKSRQYYEVYNTLEIDGQHYTDWVTLHNVTFTSILFKQPPETLGSMYAINFFYENSTGWGVSDHLNIYNSEFDGFTNAVQGLSHESEYINNYFHNYENNGLLLAYGLNITIQKNIFQSSVSPISVEQYTAMYGEGSMVGRIGLFLLDVCENVLVSNNMFFEGTNSTGIAFSSSSGNFLVTNNNFIGEGDAYLIDFNLRPFFSAGIVFYGNFGIGDFRYDYGTYTYENKAQNYNSFRQPY